MNIELPKEPSRIGVLVSGGLDSAILYYLIAKQNKELGSPHVVQPFTVMRKEGSRYFARLVITHVHTVLNLPYVDLFMVGNNTLPEEQQVRSGVIHSQALGYKPVYSGLIIQLPQHMINWQPIPYTETENFKAPLKNLDKKQIVDLVVEQKQEALFYITHSCSVLEIGRCNECNGCNERSWAFEQLNLTDPGTI